MTGMRLEMITAGHYRAHLDQPFLLDSGECLEELVLSYETLGTRNAAGDNVILIHHSLATSCHVASHSHDQADGWWEALIGPGKAIDTNKYNVICVNNLGSCFGSTGPTSINPKTQKPYQIDFPQITIEDMVRSQKLLLDTLGIEKLHAVIGGSMGGMLSLAWGHLFPKTTRNLIAISTSHKSYPLHRAHRMCQRQAIYNDPQWQDGHYAENPTDGLKLARMVSHLFYRGIEEVNKRFTENLVDDQGSNQQVISYYNYNADKFAKSYDANTYRIFLDAMDAFNLENYGDKLFKGLACTDIQVISTDTDILYPPSQQEAVYALFQQQQIPAKLVRHTSPYGHDAFLVDAQEIGNYIQTMIE